MKGLEADWARILALLPAWRELSPRARRLALSNLKPGAPQPAGPLAAVFPELEAAGWVERSPTGARVSVSERIRPLLKLLRALDRAPLWNEPTAGRLLGYLQEHFTAEETTALDPTPGYHASSWVDRRRVAEQAASAEWVESFLAGATPAEAREWEKARRSGGSAPYLEGRTELDATRGLVQALVSRPEGAALETLPGLVPGLQGPALWAALTTALRYLLLFAALDESLVPRVGLWPPALARLNRPPATPPEPVQPAAEFHAALRMEDMTSVLIAATAEPIRLRGNDGGIFARAKQALAARLVQLPDWTGQFLDENADTRIDLAHEVLLALGLGEEEGDRGSDLRLVPTKNGVRWLGHSDRDRLKALLDALRRGSSEKLDSWDRPVWSFSPLHLGYGADDHLQLRARITEAFRSLPEGFVRVDDFLTHRARVGNPLTERFATHALAGFGWGYERMRSPEHAEELWARILVSFLAERLVVLGGARLGLTASDEFCFTLTDVGRYLLGATDDFAYGYTGEAAVVVQPNFEIVFLALAPKLEAQIARFSERVGSGPGVMFRLTRASVLAAAEAGLEAAQVEQTLRAAATHALPPNVVRQIHDWFGQVRRVRMRSTLLLYCADEETASRALAAAGKELTALTPTVLEVREPTRKARTALIKRLRAQGVFVQG